MSGPSLRSPPLLPDKLDVLVLGAGPSGAVAASCLAEHCRVALVGRAHTGHIIGEALVSSARVILRDLDLWDAFQAQGHRPAWSRLSVWGSSDVKLQDAISDPHGPGWHLDRARFEAMLRRASQRRGALCIVPAQVRQLGRGHSSDGLPWSCKVELINGIWNLRCRFIVDATGRSARIARRSGLDIRRHDKLVCQYCWLRSSSQPHPGATLIEAAQDGWWYSADLPDGTSVIAWYCDSDLIGRKRMRDATDLLSRARRTTLIRSRCRDVQWLEPMRATPAHSQSLLRASGENWLAVGDACLAFDPLASQGLLHSLITGRLAALKVLAHLDGNHYALQEWNEYIQSIIAPYLANYKSYYAMEQRWTHEEFWKRRHATEADSVPSP